VERQVGAAAGRAADAAAPAMAMVHPSSILRAPDDEARRVELARFVADLASLRAAMEGRPEAAPPGA
jgi:uracil-DNA glycosylase